MPRRQADIVRAAALLHDIQTGPFGHSFQYVMEDNPFEQRFEHANLAGAVNSGFLQLVQAGAQFAGRGFEVAQLLRDIAPDVFAAIEGRGEFGPIISGTLDLDNLDNVVRLAFHMGLCDEEDRRIPRALVEYLTVVDNGLGAPPEARPLFERWFELRRRLYEYLLLDRGEFAAKAMLTLALELGAEVPLLGPDDWRLTDEQLLVELEKRSVGEHQAIGQIIKRLRVGDLFECIGVWQTSDTAGYTGLSEAAVKRDLEKDIEARLGAVGGPKIRVCLHYILDHRKTCRALSFRNQQTGVEELVGFDSKNLLVGAFVTNARMEKLSASDRQFVSKYIMEVLAGAALPGLESAPEPLGELPSGSALLV